METKSRKHWRTAAPVRRRGKPYKMSTAETSQRLLVVGTETLLTPRRLPGECEKAAKQCCSMPAHARKFACKYSSVCVRVHMCACERACLPVCVCMLAQACMCLFVHAGAHRLALDCMGACIRWKQLLHMLHMLY